MSLLVDDERSRTDVLDRVARARAVLARAEERTGTPRAVRHSGRPRAEVSSAVAQEPAGGTLPVVEHLAGLLPGSALRRGSTLSVLGSTTLVLGLAARASQEGGWVAAVGMPQVGILAAHQTGLVLDRLALVPEPGPDAATVLAALVDGVDVVLVGPRAALDDGDRRRLAARARERGAVLLSTVPWPGAAVVLTAEGSTWEGLGRGHGRLRGRRMVVHRSGRGAVARPVRFRVEVPPPRAAVLGPEATAAPVPLLGDGEERWAG